MSTIQEGWLESSINIPDNVVSLLQTAAGRLLKICVDIVSPRPHLVDYYALQGTRGSFEGTRGAGDPVRIWLEELDPADSPGKWGPVSIGSRCPTPKPNSSPTAWRPAPMPYAPATAARTTGS